MGAKILFLDLDGTLFTDAKEVTVDNRRALDAARAAGCRVVLSTGRALPGAMGLVRELELGENCYVSASNGAVLYDCAGDRVMARRNMTMADAKDLFACARTLDLHVQTYDEDGIVVVPPFHETFVREYCRMNGRSFRVLDSLEALEGPPVKVLLVGPPDRAALEKARDWIGAHMAGRAECFYSSPIFLDVMPAGVNKGYGVVELCRLLGLSPADAVAAGDEENDISMLRAAGVGAAMANAAPEVKAAADYITRRDNNHSGVAEIVEKFCL